MRQAKIKKIFLHIKKNTNGNTTKIKIIKSVPNQKH